MKEKRKIQNLTLKLGFSHDLYLDIPVGVTVECTSNSTIVLKGPEKSTLSQFAAIIRKYRRPEPYKGKGVLFKE